MVNSEMAHIPVNHRLQPFYRAVAGLCGVFVLVFGIVGYLQTRGMETFAQTDLPRVLGLTTNPAFAILSIVAGVVLLIAALIGRNLARFVNLVAGTVFAVAGMAMLTLLRTDLNILGFSVTNVVVSFILGTLLAAAGLYGKVGAPHIAEAEESLRHDSA